MSRRRISDLQRRRISQRRKDLVTATSSAALNLQDGVVVARFGRHAEVTAQDGELIVHCDIRASLASGIVCGDRVKWQMLPEGRGVIEERQARTSELQRPGPRGEPRVLAANLDRLFIISAARPEPDRRLIDQYLVCAERAGLSPVLVLNKSDLPEFTAAAELLAPYRDIGYPLLYCSSTSGAGMEDLNQAAAGATCALVGQSGVGKSSLIEQLCPQADPTIGALSQAQAIGRHTTTTARMYPFATDGRLIDAPGIREFPLLPMERDELQRCFPEFRPFLGDCRFHNCRHEEEPDCALREAVEASSILAWRLEHFRDFAAAMAAAT